MCVGTGAGLKELSQKPRVTAVLWVAMGELEIKTQGPWKHSQGKITIMKRHGLGRGEKNKNKGAHLQQHFLLLVDK